MNNVFASFFLSLFCFVIPANGALACSCTPPKPLDQALADNDYDAVFEGEVIEFKEDDERKKQGLFVNNIIVSFKNTKTWKGDLPAIVTLYTGTHSANCGYTFEKNREYLIFMNTNKDKKSFVKDADFKTDHCTHTKLLSDAEAEINLLGQSDYGNQHNE